MRFKIFKLLCLYIGINLTLMGQENIEDLEFLRGEGIITQEEYEILKGKTKILDGKYLYELRINGNLQSKIYEVIREKEKNYFPVFEFFKEIDFKNYSQEEESIRCFLGEDLREVVISPENLGFWRDKEFYLWEESFKEIFLRALRVDEENFKITMFLNFSSPREIENILERTKEKLQEEKNSKNLLYTNEGVFFEAGYLRTKIDKIYSKNENNSSKGFEDTWDGKLEYQGAFLYGQFLTSYDLKDRDLEDMKLSYKDLWKEHTLEIGNYSTTLRGPREWGVSFKKDKGYLITRNKTYIIKENVPIGSRVELLYMGIPIGVQDSVNGVVYFDNDEIKGDREYVLKIYGPDGKISLKKIDTTSDYNQQNKGQIEYNMDFREVSEGGKKVRGSSKVYYGLTNNTTIGLEFNRDVENIQDKYRYLDGGKLEVIYSNYIFSYPYTLVLGKEKSFTDIYNRGKFQTKGQIDIKKFRIKLNREERENYYREKATEEYTLEYRPINNLTLKYEIENKKFYDERREENKKYSGSYSKSYRNFLVSGEYESSTLDREKYMLNFYYSGFRRFITKLENKWEDSGKNYETAFTIFNSANGKFDYSVELRHSQRDKSMITFKFNLQYDNWFNFDMFVDKKGNQEYKFGLDRIIDLQNPRKTIENMDSTRVKVITFVDSNNNDIYDKGERKINNVKVKIGKKEIVTDERGEGVFYGIPNHMIYDLNPIIRKPSFVLGSNKIQIKGRNSSTLMAYIPIKPMLTLRGKIDLDFKSNKNFSEKVEIYRDILIKIKNQEGKVVDMSMGDEEGIFEISGLLPGQYIMELNYVGEFYRIDSVIKRINLDYESGKSERDFIFNLKVKEVN
ncbi:hypothetical protein [Cetobacterium sp. SF1]|uniref:hypothetical protein n=1 Tax=Cetobacterium sp. SF1 TaxID=3417654 RepID=UPI003CF5720A